MKQFDNKVFLITGGTGSFGNAVLKRLLSTGIKEIRIFSRDELKQDEMRSRLNDNRVKFYIGDVRDYSSLEQPMNGVDFVFHAAALKQVPSCEFFPLEAVRTNVIGADNVIQAAINSKVSRVVLLSTDKAVYPINAMGQTKALMEKIMIAKSRSLSEKHTVLCATRYGNVMASRGSVIPLFIEQVISGKKITVTDPEMTRFMMNLDEAVDLVFYALENGRQGDIFVQKSPASTIGDIAEAVRKILKPDAKVEIIGTRHGEKLFETLITREEMQKATEFGNYFRISADTRDLNYGKFFTHGDASVSQQVEYNSHNTQRLSPDETYDLLLSLDKIKDATRIVKE